MNIIFYGKVEAININSVKILINESKEFFLGKVRLLDVGNE